VTLTDSVDPVLLVVANTVLYKFISW